PLREHALALETRRVLGEEAVGVDSEWDRWINVLWRYYAHADDPGVIIVYAVTRSGMDKTSANIIGDVIAFEKRHVKIVTSSTKRMSASFDPLRRSVGNALQ